MIIEQVEGWILIMAQVKLGIVFSIDSVVYSGPSICCLFCMGFLNGQFYIRFRVIALIVLFLRRIVKWQVATGFIRIIGQGFTGIVSIFCFFDLIIFGNRKFYGIVNVFFGSIVSIFSGIGAYVIRSRFILLFSEFEPEVEVDDHEAKENKYQQ